MAIQKTINKTRTQRKNRIRSAIRSTSHRPRISVFKSNAYVYIQLIDDDVQKTIVSASTRLQDAAAQKLPKADKLVKLAQTIAHKASEKGITQAVFDRGLYRYHGVVKAIAQELRKQGITI